MRLSLEQIARLDDRYSYLAIDFVHTGLGHTARRKYANSQHGDMPSHISGQELSRGLAELAQEKWGRLAKLVLNHNGIYTTRDFGEVVYLLIEHNWMYARPEDKIEDFDDVYDFEEIFEKNFHIHL